MVIRYKYSYFRNIQNLGTRDNHNYNRKLITLVPEKTITAIENDKLDTKDNHNYRRKVITLVPEITTITTENW